MAALPHVFDPRNFAPLSEAGEAALDIAASGWPVFPCEHRLDLPGNKRNKRPLTKHGFENASTDPEQIRAWWRQFPNAMVGVPGGHRSKVWVLDIDVDPEKGHDGEADLEKLQEEHSQLPETETVITPRGGRHLLFQYAAGVTTSPGALPKSIDVRGEGGYFIVPPSKREDGKCYRRENDVEPAEAPAWLLAIIKKQPTAVPSRAASKSHSAYAEAALRDECEAVASHGEPGRNTRLNKAAFSLGQLVGAGVLDEGTVTYSLLAAAARCNLLQDDGERQCRATIASGLREGISNPRRLPERDEPSAIDLESHRALAAKANGHAEPEIVKEPERRAPALDTSDLSDLQFHGAVFDPSSMPGLLGTIASHILETALYPVPDFACLSALVLASAIYGRRWTEPILGGGLNIYVIATAPTGWGKDHPLKEPPNIAYRSEMMHLMGPGEFKSDSAIEKTLRKCPVRACFMDEIGIVFQANSNKNAASWERRLRKALLEIYSASKSMWTGSQAAGDKDEKDKGSEPLHRPILSIYGTSTPEELYKGLNEDNIRDGLFGRLIFASPGEKPKRQRPKVGHYDRLAGEIDAVRSFTPSRIPEKQKALYHANIRSAVAMPYQIQANLSGDAKASLEMIDDWQREITEREIDLSRIANRAAENAGKLATLRALSRDHHDPVVGLDDVQWAWTIIDKSLFVIAGDIERHMVGSEFEGLVKAILAHVGDAGKEGITLYELRRRRGIGRARATDLNSAFKLLENSGEISLERTGNRGFRLRRF